MNTSQEASFDSPVPDIHVVSAFSSSGVLTNFVAEEAQKLKRRLADGLAFREDGAADLFQQRLLLSVAPDKQQSAGDDASLTVLFPIWQEQTMQTLRLVFAALYSVMFIVGLTNILALFIVAKFRRMRTVTNVFIFNLCTADLIFILFLPLIITFRLKRTWIFGDVLCKLFYVAESTAKYASVYFVCVLSVDRYLALCYASWCKKNRKKSLAILVSIVGWLLTAVLMTPIYMYSEVIQLDNMTSICGVRWPDHREPVHTLRDPNRTFNSNSTTVAFSAEHYYTIYSSVFCFALPAVVILWFCGKVFHQLVQASDRAERLKKRKQQNYKRVTRMVLAMVTFYFVCWGPYWIMSFVTTFFLTSVSAGYLRILFNVVHVLPYLNCAVNPILYGLMTQTFLKTLREMLASSPCYKSRWFKCLKLVVDKKHQPTSTRTKCTNDEESPLHRHEDEDSIRHIKTSFSQSLRLMSDLCLNLVAKEDLAALSNTCSRTHSRNELNDQKF